MTGTSGKGNGHGITARGAQVSNRSREPRSADAADLADKLEALAEVLPGMVAGVRFGQRGADRGGAGADRGGVEPVGRGGRPPAVPPTRGTLPDRSGHRHHGEVDVLRQDERYEHFGRSTVYACSLDLMDVDRGGPAGPDRDGDRDPDGGSHCDETEASPILQAIPGAEDDGPVQAAELVIDSLGAEIHASSDRPEGTLDDQGLG